MWDLVVKCDINKHKIHVNVAKIGLKLPPERI